MSDTERDARNAAKELAGSGRQWSLEDLDELVETVLAKSIGVFPKPMLFRRDDPVVAGRSTRRRRRRR